MIFWQLPKLGGIWLFVFMFHEGASYERAEENGHSGSPDTDDLHLQIASEPPIKSTVDALDCASGGAERALKRNLHLNSKTGDAQMMDANALRMREASKAQAAWPEKVLPENVTTNFRRTPGRGGTSSTSCPKNRRREAKAEEPPQRSHEKNSSPPNCPPTET